MSRSTYRIYYEDTDAGNVVYHANYLKFCERARSDHIYNNNESPKRRENHFVIVEMHAKFRAPARLGDIIEVTVETVKVKHATIILHQEISRDGQLLFEMDGTFALTNAAGKPVKFSDEDKRLFS